MTGLGWPSCNTQTLAPALSTSLYTSFTIWQSAICGRDRVCPSTSTCQPLSTIQPSSSTFLVNPLPTLDSILRVRLSTLQHVPKGARDAWAGLIAEQCSSIGQDPSNPHAWWKFFMLPRCILANPTRGERTQLRITQ